MDGERRWGLRPQEDHGLSGRFQEQGLLAVLQVVLGRVLGLLVSMGAEGLVLGVVVSRPCPVVMAMLVAVSMTMVVSMLRPMLDQGQVQVGRSPGHEDQQSEQHCTGLAAAQLEP